VLQTGAPVDVPQIAAAFAFEPQAAHVVWTEFTPARFAARAGSHAQARAPPTVS
jgi:hypothetical protein